MSRVWRTTPRSTLRRRRARTLGFVAKCITTASMDLGCQAKEPSKIKPPKPSEGRKRYNEPPSKAPRHELPNEGLDSTNPPTAPLEKATIEAYYLRAKELSQMRQDLMDIKAEKLKLKTELAEAKVLAVKQDIIFLELKRENDQLKEQIKLLQQHLAEDDDVYTVGSMSPKYAVENCDEGVYGEAHDDDNEYVPQAAVEQIRSPSCSSSSSEEGEVTEEHMEQ